MTSAPQSDIDGIMPIACVACMFVAAVFAVCIVGALAFAMGSPA
jgi:hypothetical protein